MHASSDYEPSQAQETMVDHVQRRHSRSSHSGTRRTSALFAPGGALDSQTSDTQWIDAIGYSSPCSNGPVTMVDASVQTEFTMFGRPSPLICCSELRSENAHLRLQLARLEAAYRTIAGKLEAARAALDEDEDFLDPSEQSQVEMSYRHVYRPALPSSAPSSPELAARLAPREDGQRYAPGSVTVKKLGLPRSDCSILNPPSTSSSTRSIRVGQVRRKVVVVESSSDEGEGSSNRGQLTASKRRRHS
ncbi:hypothetical protein C8Q73DRAFT_681566 [Cubamyces lactineus]|nr:hypothetical protein C8Q73DRAFT_681566 [Cubamyces lactineus]